jgi:hypothetical protein
MAFCRVNSRLTGRRLVSLPFSDHCEPLMEEPRDLELLVDDFQKNWGRERWDYIECRPLKTQLPAAFATGATYYLHMLDLRLAEDQLFARFHKDSIQRKIRRAEREALTHREGTSIDLLQQFYRLLLMTRRRHQMLPQPYRWFRNLIEYLGDQLKIRVAYKQQKPIASILTLRFKKTLVYKYGCSDPRFHNLGGMQSLFWRAIQEGKRDGLQELDLGRSSCDNQGLVTFKDRWGARRSMVTYRCWRSQQKRSRSVLGEMRFGKKLFSVAPDRFLSVAGSLLYRHFG